jgi:hypothetical protein
MSEKQLGKEVNTYMAQTGCLKGIKKGGCSLINRETREILSCGGPVASAEEEQHEKLCSDGLDNDEDSYVDCEDSDCSGIDNCKQETDCSDGKDNDNDGRIDCDDLDCAGFSQCQITKEVYLTVNAPELNICPEFATNEQDYKYQTSVFQQLLITEKGNTNYAGTQILSESDGILKSASFQTEEELEVIKCCNSSCSLTSTSKQGCILGDEDQEYLYCGSIRSSAKFSVGKSKYSIRPDDVLLNAFLFKQLQQNSTNTARVIPNICKVPSSKVIHYGNISAVVTESNLETVSALAKDDKNGFAWKSVAKDFINKDPKHNLCFVYDRLDRSSVPQTLAFSVMAPYATDTSIDDARVNPLFKKIYSNSKKLSKYKDWVKLGTDDRFSLIWYKGLEGAFHSPKNTKLKEPNDSARRSDISKKTLGTGKYRTTSDAALKCKGRCSVKEIDFRELTGPIEISQKITDCKNQKKGCCTFSNVYNPKNFINEDVTEPEPKDPSMLALFGRSSSQQIRDKSKCVGLVFRIISESPEIRQNILGTFDESRGFPIRGEDLGNYVRPGGLLPSYVKVGSKNESLKNSKPKLSYATAAEAGSCGELVLAFDQNSKELRQVANVIKNQVNEKSKGAVSLTVPSSGVDLNLGDNAKFDILLALKPYYTTKSQPSIESFLIPDTSVGRGRVPLGDDTAGTCGKATCSMYKYASFNGNVLGTTELEKLVSKVQKCSGNIYSTVEKLQACEEFYQKSKSPVLILDYYSPFTFSIGPECSK